LIELSEETTSGMNEQDIPTMKDPLSYRVKRDGEDDVETRFYNLRKRTIH
jgi:hypothetical protein